MIISDGNIAKSHKSDSFFETHNNQFHTKKNMKNNESTNNSNRCIAKIIRKNKSYGTNKNREPK